jgi:hypothetical protein
VIGMRELAVEREASWGITKSQADGGFVIDVGDCWRRGPGWSQKELEHVLGMQSCFLST